MVMAIVAGGLFFLGWFIGQACGENIGYQKGWKDKERGNPYKAPR
jgi:hypothetical protein